MSRFLRFMEALYGRSFLATSPSATSSGSKKVSLFSLFSFALKKNEFHRYYISSFLVKISNEEAEGPWQRGIAYKGFGPSVKSVENINVEAIPSLQEQPVQSAITDPLPNRKLAPGVNTIKGFAYSGGGRRIIRVDVSADGGKTWTTGRMLLLPFVVMVNLFHIFLLSIYPLYCSDSKRGESAAGGEGLGVDSLGSGC